jgi:hypothetical protein
MRAVPGAAVLALLVAAVGARAPDQQDRPPDAASRAVAFLSVEVPRWKQDFGCYSCHNNGDAVRALVRVRDEHHEVDRALADTLAFLTRPVDWRENSQGGALDDQALARIQFAGALTDAVAAGLAPKGPLETAARLLAADQDDDGAWRQDSANSLGSPATYGTALATWSARRTLAAAGLAELEPAIARADAWLRGLDPMVTPDLAAVVLALADADDDLADARRRVARDRLLANQHRSGGWGPYPTVRPEPFDTALAVLALEALPDTPELEVAIARGRSALRDTVLSDGSWEETTRPAGQRSYAQRISTTAWAVLALRAKQE